MAALEIVALDTATPQLEVPQSGDTYSAPRALDISPQSLTGSSATTSLNVAQTWNTTGTPTAVKVTVTDTASNAASLLMNLQVGSTSRFGVLKDGTVYLQGGTSTHFIANSNGGGLACNSFGTLNDGTYDAIYSGYGVRFTTDCTLGWAAASTIGIGGGTPDTIICRKAAATLQFGASDAAAPVAQTLGVQSVVAGTSNTAGTAFTINGSRGTGTGVGGDIIFQVAPAGASGTAQNTLAQAMRIYNTKTVAVGSAFTVSTLPAAGTQGRRAWVTDATAPTFLGTLTGGGAVVCPVFDNGTAWVAG